MYRYVTTPTWRETIVRIAALLRLGIKQDIVQQVGVDRKRLEEEESIERKPGSGRPLKLDTSTIRDTVEAKPHKSIRSHAKDMAVSRTLVSRAIKKEGGKSLTMKKKPLLTDAIKVTHLLRCKGLLNKLKSGKAGRITIFSDEKTWTVDPVHNRKNDRYITSWRP